MLCDSGQLINLLAYADDFVLIASSWRAIQRLLSVLDVQISSLDVISIRLFACYLHLLNEIKL